MPAVQRLPRLLASPALIMDVLDFEVQVRGLTQRLERARLNQSQRKLQKDIEQVLKKTEDGLAAFGLLMDKLRNGAEAKVGSCA